MLEELYRRHKYREQNVEQVTQLLVIEKTNIIPKIEIFSENKKEFLKIDEKRENHQSRPTVR